MKGKMIHWDSLLNEAAYVIEELGKPAALGEGRNGGARGVTNVNEFISVLINRVWTGDEPGGYHERFNIRGVQYNEYRPLCGHLQ